MIRAAALKKLLQEKVAPQLQAILEPLGYKYKKTQSRFVHKEGIGEKVIWLSADFKPLAYDEDLDEIRIQFELNCALLLSKFDKWYQKEIGNEIYTHIFHKKLAGYWVLEESDLEDADFYEPTAAQQFKRQVTQYLKGSNQNQYFCLDDSAKALLEALNKELSGALAIDKLLHTEIQIAYNNFANQPFKIYPHLLIFDHKKEEAEAAFDQAYQKYRDQLALYEGDDSREAEWGYKLYRKMLEQMIKDADLLIAKAYPNPFGALISLKNNQNRTIYISEQLQFREILRFDMSSVGHHLHSINPKGEILFWIQSEGLFKFDAQGKLVFQVALQLDESYPALDYIEELDCFYINNYLLNKDHQLITLAPPKKGKKIRTKDLRLFTYDPSNKQLLSFYQLNRKKGLFCTYDQNYKLKEGFELQGNIMRFVPEKEWMIMDSGKSHEFWNYAGVKLFELPYKNGNSYFQLSPDNRYFLSHFYSTKSDWHDLEKGTSTVIWGHPTYVKGYKKQLYSDVFNNFGLMKAKFSPDGKYLVGAADHGKYVAWELPELKRIELFPNEVALNQMEHAEIIDLEGERFLKNRNHNPMAIHMLEGGDYFFMEFKDHIWVWDRNFQHLHTFEHTGRMSAVDGQFLIGQTGQELVIYKKV
jgi:hypothetical protein